MDLTKIIQSRLEKAIDNGDKKVDVTVADEVIGFVDLTMYYAVIEAIQIGVLKERDNLNDSEVAKLIGKFSSKYSDKLFPFEWVDDFED